MNPEYIFSFEQDPYIGRLIFLGLLALVSIVVFIWDRRKK
jgi:hypothetical protein